MCTESPGAVSVGPWGTSPVGTNNRGPEHGPKGALWRDVKPCWEIRGAVKCACFHSLYLLWISPARAIGFLAGMSEQQPIASWEQEETQTAAGAIKLLQKPQGRCRISGICIQYQLGHGAGQRGGREQ